ncbi:hypothetical protein [Butyrivibrio sp. XBB1001]|uniref:hypothetical protein n=1 Tax=Butyrivibrio sp. XBB1001 TaxID=1280682 RepID=UPI0004124AA5|nr:hypothetical protein [Butyrivibrio sp. XBB1001]
MTPIVLLPVILAISLWKKVKFEYIAPIVMMCTTMVAYAFGASIGFIWAKYLLIVLALVSLLYVVQRIRGNLDERLKEYGFSVLAYVVIFIWLLLVMQNRYIADKDAQLVWARFAKEFYYFGRINRFSYIPGMISWNTLSLYFWKNESDAVLLVGQAFFTAYMLVSIVEDVKIKNHFTKIMLTLVAILLPCLSKDGYGYYSLALDTFIGVLAAYILIKIRNFLLYKTRIDAIGVCLGIVILVLSKKAGFVLALMLITVLLCCEAFSDNKQRFSKQFNRVLICAVIAVLASLLIWDALCFIDSGYSSLLRYLIVLSELIHGSLLDLAGIASLLIVVALAMVIIIKKQWMLVMEGLTIGVLLFGFAGVTMLIPLEIRQSTINSFLKCIFSINGRYVVYGFGYAILIPFYVIILAVDLCYFFVLRKEDKTKRKLDTNFITWINIGFLIYTLFVYYANLSTRTLEQTARSAECNRYLFTYILIFVIIGLYKILTIEYKDSKLVDVVISILLVVLLATSNFPVASFDRITTYYTEFINVNENDTIYLVDQKDKVDKYSFYYLITPGNYVYLQEDKMMENADGSELSLDEWKRHLIEYGCTYVYVFSIDDDFEANYGSMFDGPVLQKTLYTVEYTENDLRLKYYYCFEGA